MLHSVSFPSARTFEKSQLATWQLMVAGGCAGVAFNATFFPADVLKSIFQTQSNAQLGVPAGLSKRQAVYHVVRKIYRADGVRGFYQGLGITVLRAIPSNAVIFLTFETLSSWLNS
jgi:ornithine carrier protein